MQNEQFISERCLSAPVRDLGLVVGATDAPRYDWPAVLVRSEVTRFSLSEAGPSVVMWGGHSDTLSGRAARGWYNSFVAAKKVQSNVGGLRGTTRATDDGTAACSRHGEEYGCRFDVAQRH